MFSDKAKRSIHVVKCHVIKSRENTMLQVENYGDNWTWCASCHTKITFRISNLDAHTVDNKTHNHDVTHLTQVPHGLFSRTSWTRSVWCHTKMYNIMMSGSHLDARTMDNIYSTHTSSQPSTTSIDFSEQASCHTKIMIQIFNLSNSRSPNVRITFWILPARFLQNSPF
jgi:hypothetical protein